jgi:hypothetical protein
MQTFEGHGFQLLAHLPFNCVDICMHRNGIAYISHGWEGVAAYDITNLSNFRFISKVRHNYAYPWAITIQGNTLIISEHPIAEEELFEKESLTSVEEIEYALNQELAFALKGAVRLIDITSIKSPRHLHRIAVADFVDYARSDGEYLYVLANEGPEPYTGKLLVASLKDKYKIISEVVFPQRVKHLQLVDKTVYVGASNGVFVVNISSVSQPQIIQHIGDRASLNTSRIRIQNDHFYATAEFQGLRIFRRNREGKLSAVHRERLWGPATDIIVENDTIYVADAWHGVWRYQLREMDIFVEAGFFPIKHTINHKILRHGGRLFIAAQHAGLYVLQDTEGCENLNLNKAKSLITRPIYRDELS